MSTEVEAVGTGPPPAPPARGRGEAKDAPPAGGRGEEGVAFASAEKEIRPVSGVIVGGVSADEAPSERLHPVALLSGFGQAIRNIAGGIAAGGYFAFQGRLGTAVLVLGGIVMVTLAGLLLHWWRFSFRVGADTIRIDSGILSRNQRTIPFDRVADVSIAQGPIQRLVGIARVTLETGGSSGGAEEGVLAGIALGRAEALRDHVRARRIAFTVEVPAIAGTTGEAEAAPLFAMDVRRVLTLGIFSFSLALFAGLFGASQTFGDLLNIDPFERDFWRPILQQSGWGAWLLDHRLGLVLGGVTVLVVAGVVTGQIRTLLREYGFRLDRTGNGFRRRRGLVTRTDVSLPLRRIQAGLIGTGPVRDRFGWRAFKVLSLAGESGQGDKKGGGDHVLAPLATDAEIAPIAERIGLVLPGPETPWQKVSRAHVTAFAAVLAPVLLVIAGANSAALAIGGVPAPSLLAPPLVAALLFLFLAGLRLLEWHHTAHAMDGDRVLIRSGWWSRRTLLIPLRNIQNVTLEENSLGRRFGIATLAIDVAGGRSTGQRIPSLPRNQASLLLRELLSRQP